MTVADYDWQSLQETTTEAIDAETLESWANTLNVSPIVISMCLSHGVTTFEALEEFLSDSPQLWHDPMLMHDMDKAVERIQQAIETGEQILIFGDYDADGITSTAILYETLETLGANVVFYLPNRFTDGYGPNQRVFETYIEQGVTLIITVDCGIAAHEPIEWAMSQHVDVILTDHHEIPPVIPKAYAVVHPRHPEAAYPFGDLSGAGVALKVAHALLGEFPEELSEVATIGTIADLVSLTDENRTLVKLGLQQLRHTQRVGLMTVIDTLELKRYQIDEKTIGFQIAPRFNALGRLGDAAPGVTLLTTFDEEEAQKIVDFMQSENARRQQIVDMITTEALEMADHQKENDILVLAQKNWHEGVLGIVASRIVEKLGKPTLVLSIQDDGLEAKGSGRSCGQFNLYQALTACSGVLTKFGGHHMAAGLSLETVLLPALVEQLQTYAQKHSQELTAKTVIPITKTLALKEVTVSLIDSLAHLKPFGTDNEEPVFEIENLTVVSMQQLGENKQHLKLSLGQEELTLQAVAFQKGEWANQLNLHGEVSVIGTLAINEWQGNRLPQLMLKDVDYKSPLVFDWRTTKIRLEQLQVADAVYLVETPQLQSRVAERIPDSSVVMTMSHFLQQFDQHDDKVAIVLFDCPVSRQVIEEFRSHSWRQRIYIIAYTPKSMMTIGLPNRERFKKAYHYFKTHPKIPYDKSTGNVATFLNIPLEQFKMILKVFFELEFVIIRDGFLEINPTPQTVDLMESPLMKQLQEQVWLEKVFVYSQFQELTHWLTNEK